MKHGEGDNQVSVKVNLGHCKFKEAPIIVTSLVGESEHWATTGGSSPYYPSARGFTIHVRCSVGSIVNGELQYPLATVERARRHQWRIHWIAVGECDS